MANTINSTIKQWITMIFSTKTKDI